MNKRLLILAVLISAACAVYAQNERSKPTKDKKNKDKDSAPITAVKDGDNLLVEFNVKEAEGGYKQFTLGDQGTILYYDSKDETKGGGNEYEFIRFDKELNEVYRTRYDVPKGMMIQKSVEDNGNVYMLLHKELKGASTQVIGTYATQYTIVRFNSETKEFKSFDGLVPEKGGYYSGFEVVNDVAYVNYALGASPGTILAKMCISTCTCFIPMIFGFNNLKRHPVMVVYDLGSKKKKEVIIPNKGKTGVTAISSFVIDDSTNVCTMLLTYRHKKVLTAWMKTVDRNGNPGKDINVKIPADKQLENVRIANVNGKTTVFGEYGKKSASVSFGNSYGGTSQGIYFGVLNNNNLEKLNFYPYKTLKNLKMPLSRGEARKMKKDAKKDKETAINLGVHFLPPLVYNDEVILVGEVYYATYRTETYTTYQNGRMVTHTRTVFDGWAFSNILFAGFDLDAKMIWNNSIEYNRPKSFYIYDRVKPVLQDDGSVSVVYNDGFRIKTASVNGEKIVQGTKTVDIGGGKSGDKVKSAETGGADVVYWYDDYYLATGTHDIKNKELKGKEKKRTVYYMKRIEFAY